MFIQPVSTRWKHTTNPVHSYQQSNPPHHKEVKPSSIEAKQFSDEVTVSDRSYLRLQNLHSQRKLEPIRDLKEAQSMMGIIHSKIIEQEKTILYVHDVIPSSTVLTLLTPARPLSTSIDIQIQDFSAKAP